MEILEFQKKLTGRGPEWEMAQLHDFLAFFKKKSQYTFDKIITVF